MNLKVYHCDTPKSNNIHASKLVIWINYKATSHCLFFSIVLLQLYWNITSDTSLTSIHTLVLRCSNCLSTLPIFCPVQSQQTWCEQAKIHKVHLPASLHVCFGSPCDSVGAQFLRLDPPPQLQEVPEQSLEGRITTYCYESCRFKYTEKDLKNV